MSSLQQVTDIRSNPADQIRHAATVIGRSKHKQVVFRAICYGKRARKTVGEIAKTTGLSAKRVLDAGKALGTNGLVHQTGRQGQTSYVKDNFFSARWRKILHLATNPKKLEKLATKVTPKAISYGVSIRVTLPRKAVRTEQITIGDIENFSKARRLSKEEFGSIKISEKVFKRGIQSILGQKGKFTDWGGESNDLLTTNVRVGGRRIPAAFAFKGPGKRGILTAAGMGKNGDQIQRLFQSPATLFLVQYWDRIHENVISQMQTYAVTRSVTTGEKVYYGSIDGQDSARLIRAYPRNFRSAS